MSLINFKSIKNLEFGYNFQENFSSKNADEYDFHFKSNTSTTHEYNKNLKLRYGSPEIKSETNLPEDKLIKLKHSESRQKLSIILHECDNKCFSIQKQDEKLLNIIGHSGLLEKLNFEEQLDKILISKTNKIVSVIQGINQLDTENMTESEMESKAKEFSRIIETEKSSMARLRELLNEGAELAKQYTNPEKNSNENIEEKIRAYDEKFSKFAQSASGDNKNKTE